MDICPCDITAFEVYRSHGRLLPELLECPRTSKLDACGMPPRQMLADELGRLGAKTPPYHLAFASPNQAKQRNDVMRHVYSAPLPRRALIRIGKGLLIASPELLFAQLAARSDFDEIDLALAGYELCGTYVMDPDDESWTGLIGNVSAMTRKQLIASMVARLGKRHGIARARKALALFEDGSNSPMETILALLFHLPRRLGGLGLGPISMNQRVSTSTGDRWVDVYFVGRAVGMEYKGRRPHSVEKTARDDRRQNKLAGSGVTVLNVWYEDLASDHLFQQLVQDVANSLSMRLRIRSRQFTQSQKLLRMRLMPAIERLGEWLG